MFVVFQTIFVIYHGLTAATAAAVAATILLLFENGTIEQNAALLHFRLLSTSFAATLAIDTTTRSTTLLRPVIKISLNVVLHARLRIGELFEAFESEVSVTLPCMNATWMVLVHSTFLTH